MNMKEALTLIGHRLKQRRIHLEMTQSEVGLKAGLSIPTINKIENGGSIALASCLKLMEVLKTLNQLDDFLPEPQLTPREIVKLKKKPQRVRVRKPNDKGNKDSWQW